MKTLLLAFALAAPAFALDLTGFQPIGDVAQVARTNRGVQLRCADGAQVDVTVLAPDLARIRTRFAGQPDTLDHSWALADVSWPAAKFEVGEAADAVTITTNQLEVVVRRSPLLIEFRDPATHRTINADERPMERDPKTGRIAATKKLGLNEHFYGLGEKAARLDRRRGQFTMWNSDTPAYTEGTDPIYQSIPFYLGLDGGRGYGLFYDNSYRTHFDLGHTQQEYAGFMAEGGVMDYYFFAGPSLKRIVSRYTELTGRMPLPPLWALGNQQCRYSYYPAAMVEEIAQEYRAHDLPLDVLYLDIHYMDGYRVFTWNKERFPDPSGLTARLGAEGVKLVTIIDPGVKYQPEGGYRVFDEGMTHDYFLRRTSGQPYVGEVWPGKAVFVDYTREDARRWWGEQQRALVDRGVAGIWTDMNEPSDFIDKSGDTQKDVVFDDLGQRSLYAKNRNVFALNMARATYEGLQRLRPNARPFVITRAGYAGVQRYSTMWIGDSVASFDALALSIPMYASLGLSGEAFVGGDLPGFIGRGDGELLARSYELATFVPLCRNHGAIDDYDHEPWRYGAPYEAIVRKYLNLRYRMLPYLYATLEEAHRTGVPLFRPLLLNFQDDPTALNLDDEFMIGDALLVAPVVRGGARQRDLYLPAGRWYDFWSGEPTNSKGDLVQAQAALDQMPLFVRGGNIVPSTVAMHHVGEKPWDPIRFDIYPNESNEATGGLYEDDGLTPEYRSGAYRRTAVSWRAGELRLSAPEGKYVAPPRTLEFVLHGVVGATAVAIDGQPASAGALRTDERGVLRISVGDDGRAHTIRVR